jgi:hypothetical protein
MKSPALKLAALAIAGLAAFSPAAKAQTVTTAVGDLILGVYQTNNLAPGYGQTYEVDLGSFTSFPSTASNVSLSSKVSITDLDAIFGGSSGLAQTSWFVAGTQGTPALTYPGGSKPNAAAVFITDSASNAPTTTDAEGNTLATPSGQIGGLQSGLFGAATYSSNSSVAAEFSVSPPANAPQFSLTEDINPQEGFAASGSFYELNPAPAGRGAGEGGGAPGTVVSLGSFDFVGGTTFTFNPVAAPEPSSYVLLGLGALLLVIKARSRKTSI